MNDLNGVELVPASALAAARAEITRLEGALRYEQHLATRIGTHSPGCHAWGPSHYECAMRELAKRDTLIAELRQELEEQVRLNGMGSEREARLMAEIEEGARTLEHLREKVLHPLANIIKGEPQPLSRHSWDDLPEMVSDLQFRAANKSGTA